MQKKQRILLVDDQYSNRFLMSEILEEYDIAMASNGNEMWEEIKKKIPDLILLDVMMPVEDGFSLAKKIQSNPDYNSIPIIFVTAKVTGSDINEGFTSGAFDYIKKPFNHEELITRVKKALDNTAKTQNLKTRAITGDMIFENMLEGLIITNNDFKILSCNPACTNIIDYTKDELSTIFLPDLIFDDYNNPIAIGKLLNTKQEVLILTKSQKLLPVSLTVSLIIDENSNELGCVCMFHDISERKTMQQNLINAKEQAEQAAEMKTVFLAKMSHEIRTPLNAIIGFTDLLEEPDLTEEDKLKYYGIIKNNGQKLVSFINNLLEVSSLETQKIQLYKNTCYPVEVIHSLFDDFIEIQKKHKKTNITFTKHILIPDTLTIFTDEKRLYQCLYNVIDNAFKFTTEGNVEITCKMHESTKFLEFIVQDTGIGIVPELENKIFEHFYKIQSNKIDITPGLGMGLAISKNIATILGGSISLKSQPNIGSTFTIRIPIE